MVATDRQHRHLKAPVREQSPIVDRILVKGSELRKACVHASRTRVQRGVVNA